MVDGKAQTQAQAQAVDGICSQSECQLAAEDDSVSVAGVGSACGKRSWDRSFYETENWSIAELVAKAESRAESSSERAVVAKPEMRLVVEPIVAPENQLADKLEKQAENELENKSENEFENALATESENEFENGLIFAFIIRIISQFESWLVSATIAATIARSVGKRIDSVIKSSVFQAIRTTIQTSVGLAIRSSIGSSIESSISLLAA